MQQVVVEVVTRDEDVASATGRRFVVRWVRRKAFLYQRAVKGEAVGTGRPIVEDKLLGQVDTMVAQEWQARGDWSVPPPLQTEEPAPPRPANRPPAPAPPVDSSKRLSAALWLSQTFHAAEMERLRLAQAAADEAFAAQFLDEQADAAKRTPKSSRRSGPKDAEPECGCGRRSAIRYVHPTVSVPNTPNRARETLHRIAGAYPRSGCPSAIVDAEVERAAHLRLNFNVLDEDEYFPPRPSSAGCSRRRCTWCPSTFGVPAPPSPTTAAASRPATVLTSQ